MVTVDGEIPADGASISFIPQDGKSPSAGDTLKKGAYLCLVPIGASKVEIRVPRPRRKPKTINKEGPGSGPSGDWIEESLPPEFNAKTTLTFTVNSGKNEKNWDLQTKKK
ncbi:hypothetical protein KIH39_06130 [Telmatocola sphagniphila]|uniref:Uncharacterized protein n=1 Tax=Telmatocola sphagniphila TaxID=1123043 RepID=A0A8E6B988_9BACT|nr:hypothetical protein [Telmatocola sphagniphila]QVL33486.1 hypothetical protein KIH39_06130 [Telmatocola sphagniphila]